MNGRLREQVAATVQLAGPTPWVGLRGNEEGEVANLPFPALCSALERSFRKPLESAADNSQKNQHPTPKMSWG